MLDAETKEPVEGAWISATIGVKTKTVAGDVGQVISIAPPHLRTGKDGKFVIPMRELKKPPFPVGFGTEVDEVVVRAVTINKRGAIKVGINDLEKPEIEAKIFIEDEEKLLQEEYPNVSPNRLGELREISMFSNLQSLYNYCLTGRFGIEIPPVEGGCDDWELNYAITKHERYLERYKKEFENELKKHKEGIIKDYRDNIIIHYGGILEQLGLLYEKKGEYEKAIENLRKAKEIRFFRPQDIDAEINRIQQKLQQKQK